MPAPSDPKRPSNPYLRYSGLAFQLLGGIGVAGWLGYLLDGYLGMSFPLFMLAFIVMTLTGMLYQIHRKFNEE